MSEAFKQGDHVVYQAHGIGKVTGIVQQGPDADRHECLALSFPSGLRAFIPVEKANSSLRHLMSKAEAESDLEILRKGGTERDSRMYRERFAERARILKSGTREEVATLLRKLYAAKAPVSEGDGRAIKELEELVLGEISLVLGIPRDQLEGEMRERYPVFAKKRA